MAIHNIDSIYVFCNYCRKKVLVSLFSVCLVVSVISQDYPNKWKNTRLAAHAVLCESLYAYAMRREFRKQGNYTAHLGTIFFATAWY